MRLARILDRFPVPHKLDKKQARDVVKEIVDAFYAKPLAEMAVPNAPRTRDAYRAAVEQLARGLE